MHLLSLSIYPIITLDIQFNQCYLDENPCRHWLILDPACPPDGRRGFWIPDVFGYNHDGMQVIPAEDGIFD